MQPRRPRTRRSRARPAGTTSVGTSAARAIVASDTDRRSSSHCRCGPRLASTSRSGASASIRSNRDGPDRGRRRPPCGPRRRSAATACLSAPSRKRPQAARRGRHPRKPAPVEGVALDRADMAEGELGLVHQRQRQGVGEGDLAGRREVGGVDDPHVRSPGDRCRGRGAAAPGRRLLWPQARGLTSRRRRPDTRRLDLSDRESRTGGRRAFSTSRAIARCRSLTDAERAPRGGAAAEVNPRRASGCSHAGDMCRRSTGFVRQIPEGGATRAGPKAGPTRYRVYAPKRAACDGPDRGPAEAHGYA